MREKRNSEFITHEDGEAIHLENGMKIASKIAAFVPPSDLYQWKLDNTTGPTPGLSSATTTSSTNKTIQHWQFLNLSGQVRRLNGCAAQINLEFRMMFYEFIPWRRYVRPVGAVGPVLLPVPSRIDEDDGNFQVPG